MVLEVCDVCLLRANRLRSLLEASQFSVGQVALNDLLDALATDLGLDAKVDAVDAVLAVNPRADWNDVARVGDNGLRHPSRRSRRGVVSRPSLEQRNNLRATVAGTGDELVDLVCIHDVGQRLSVDETGRR